MPTATSQRVVNALWDHIVLHYGFPHEILSDRGRNFLAPIVTAFLRKANIKRLTTSAYHPRTNGKVERYNGILESYLQRMNSTGDKTRWDEFLDAALFATRVRHREGSRWSPFELLYGCKPRLARDEPILHAPDTPIPTESELTDRLQDLATKRQEAQDREQSRAERDKQAFDKQVRKGESHKPGDVVLLRNNQAQKMDPRWTGPWVVNSTLDKGNLRIQDLRGNVRPDPVHVNQTRPAVVGDKPHGKPWFLPRATRRAWAKEDEGRAAEAEHSLERRLPAIKIIGRFAEPNPQPLPGERTEGSAS